jgi:hypothetical protein
MRPPKKKKFAQFEPTRQGARLYTNQQPDPAKGPFVELCDEDEQRMLGIPPEHWALVDNRVVKAEENQPLPPPPAPPAIIKVWASRALPYLASALLGALIHALIRLSIN